MDNISVFRKRELIQSDEYLNKEQFKILQEMITCPICLSILNQPVYTKSCSHRFCKDCIEKAIRSGGQKECPLCRKEVGTKRMLRQDTEIQSLADSIYGNVETYNKQVEEQNSQFIKENYGELSLNLRKQKSQVPKLQKQESIPKLQKSNSELSTSQIKDKEQKNKEQKDVKQKEKEKNKEQNKEQNPSTNNQNNIKSRQYSRRNNNSNSNSDFLDGLGITAEERRVQQELLKKFEVQKQAKQRRKGDYEYIELQSTRRKKVETDHNKKQNYDDSQLTSRHEFEESSILELSPQKSKKKSIKKSDNKKKNKQNADAEDDEEHSINNELNIQDKQQETQSDQQEPDKLLKSNNKQQFQDEQQEIEIPLDNDEMLDENDNDNESRDQSNELDPENVLQLKMLFDNNPQLLLDIETFITCKLERLPTECFLPKFQKNIFKTNSKVTIEVLRCLVGQKLNLKQKKQNNLLFYIKTQQNSYESLSLSDTLRQINDKYWEQKEVQIADSSQLFKEAIDLYQNKNNKLQDGGDNRIIYYSYDWGALF